MLTVAKEVKLADKKDANWKVGLVLSVPKLPSADWPVGSLLD